MPNAFAYLMLAIWPVVTWQLYRRLSPGKALIWTILAGYLLLPPVVRFDLPAIPDLDKYSIPSLMAAVCVVLVVHKRLELLPENWLGRLLMAAYVLGPFGTVLTNTDPILFEQGQIGGMKVYDSFSAVANQLIWLSPLFLGRQFLGSPEGMQALARALVLGGLAYAAPMLLEAQVSPQLNIWIYGFFQHDFFQTIRYGGYRPVVFLPHGLWVAFFTLMCLMSAVILLRVSRPEARPKALAIVVFLGVMLVVCKSAGVLAYAVFFVPLLLLFGARTQILVAAVVAALVVVYPLLRGLHVVPLDQIVDFATSISPERGQSLFFRIDNEEILLARAEERPVFGWGGFNRNFTHDPITGETLNIADGAWIILLGIYGWIGYLADFGLTALPLWLLGREALIGRKADLSPLTAGMAMILAASMLDFLPNATQVPLTWLLVGALLGEAERLRALRKARAVEQWRMGLHGGRASKTVI